ncbi:MAG: DUF1214 domain-containing protein [Pseudomonadota bacterium]
MISSILKNPDWIPTFFSLPALLLAISLTTSAAISRAEPVTSPKEYFSDAGQEVTEAMYPRAETARQMINAQAVAGAVNRFVHRSSLTATDYQPVVRMNRDSYYSSAVVDVSQGASITLPSVPEGKYLSMQPITEDHRTQPMSYGGGTYELATHTGSHVYIIIRLDSTFSPEEVKRYQSGMYIDAVSAQPFSAEPIQRQSFMDVENRLKAKRKDLLKLFEPDEIVRGMFTAPTDASRAFYRPVLHQIASASGWGGAQVRDNVYEFVPALAAEGCYQATFEDPGNRAFWSFTVYNPLGFLFDDVAHVNSDLATPNPDGTFTVSLGCEAGAPNQIPIINETGKFTVTIRHYQPSERVIQGYRLARFIKKVES